MAEVRQEEHYLDIIRYHVTLVAEADRMLNVVSTRVLLAGGIGAAGGGLGGAAAGAGAGAVAGDNLTGFLMSLYYQIALHWTSYWGNIMGTLFY